MWSGSNRLVGLFPARIERRGPLTRLAGWTHPFAPLGTPLVDRDEAEAAIAAWLDHLAADASMPDLLLLPLLPEQGAFAAALDAVLAQQRPRQRERSARTSAPCSRRAATAPAISGAPCPPAAARNCAGSAAAWRRSRR